MATLKNKEKVFSISGKTDRKSKLNKLNKNIDAIYLDKIEQGITIEGIDKMKISGLPILKYQTQITIHGLFPRLNNNYVYGYKNIFQNKNKSIGVKYNAIDEAKRREIAEKVRPIGWSYKRNSSSFNFELVRVVDDKSKVPSKIDELRKLSDKIDTSLFYGGKSIYYGSVFGRWYIILDVHVGAIYQKDVPTLIEQMGADKKALDKAKEQKEKEQAERNAYWAKREAESEKKKQQAKMKHKEQLDKLNSDYKKVLKTNEQGVYIKPSFNYNDEVVYKWLYVYNVKGKKKPRISRKEFKQFNEAIKNKAEASYSDDILKGTVSGYKIQ